MSRDSLETTADASTGRAQETASFDFDQHFADDPLLPARTLAWLFEQHVDAASILEDAEALDGLIDAGVAVLP